MPQERDKSPFFLRRDMPYGLTAFIGEEQEADRPFVALTDIRSPMGHIVLALKQNGEFIIEVHPEGGEPIDVVGHIRLGFAIIETVGEVTLNKRSKEKMN